VQEVGHVHAQLVRNQQEMADLRVTGSALDALDCRPVDAGERGETFLGEVLVQSADADTVAKGSTGVEDPWRLVGGRHSTNAQPLMIISQQQNCGII
jgi:hypothetical protein